MKPVIDCKPRKVVLRRAIDDDAMGDIIDAKKATAFRSLLSSPKKADIHTHSVRLAYEATTMLSGEYRASYYRKATHPIRVDHNVQRVEIGDGVFEPRRGSRLAGVISGPRAKKRVDLDLEEYVVDMQAGSILVDHHGHKVRRFAHKLDPDLLESYPTRILGSADIVREPELSTDAMIARLCEKLAPRPAEGAVRDLSEEATVKKITHVYVPVIEARLVGPKRRVRILRIDGVSKKVLKV